MTVYNWLSTFGLPTLISGVITGIVGFLLGILTSSKATREGVQALLKTEMKRIYKECNTRGYASIDEKDDFEYLYKRYHKLGANGVMDCIRARMMDLPTTKQN